MIRASLLALVRDRSRTAATVLAVTLVVAMIAIPGAIRESAISKPQNYLARAGVDAFVMGPGVGDYISQSVLSPDQIASVPARPGIDVITAGVVGFATLHHGDESASVVIQGYEPESGFGGPWSMASGAPVSGDDEVVIDETLGDQLGVSVGAQVEIGRGRFTVAGLSAETASIGKQLVFLTTPAVQSAVYDQPLLVTHLLVGSDDPSGFVRAARSAGFSAFTRSDLLDRNEAYWTRQIGPTFDMMLLVVVLFGSLLVLTLFLLSNRARRRHLAVQAALGVPLRTLVAAEVVSAVAVTSVGLVAGLALAALGVGAVNGGSPGLEASLSAPLLVRSMVTVAAVVLLALVPSLTALRRIDPADALAEPT